MNLAAALTREHHQIDAGIEEFVASLQGGVIDAQPLMTAFAALRRHIYLEEEFLFPPIRQAGLMMPVLVMAREHGAIWLLMDALSEELADERPDLEEIETMCRDLLGRLDQHNSKEEPIIYPQADTALSEEAAASLADFVTSGAMPAGWVCEEA